jgi:hypothetical protein
MACVRATDRIKRNVADLRSIADAPIPQQWNAEELRPSETDRKPGQAALPFPDNSPLIHRRLFCLTTVLPLYSIATIPGTTF